MAYPPYGEPGVTPTRERIKPGVEKSGISHSDMHGGNIMFGDAWEDDEHYGCNPLRLIDFGISEWLEDVEAANAKNLREVGWNIVHLALMKPAPFLSPGSARKYNLDESTGLIIKSQSSSSASSQSNPPGNSDLSMGGSDNSNDQSGPKDASMMDVDNDDDDYAPAADDPDDPEEYEDDDDGDLLGDVSMMSIDPNNLSGLSGSSIAQGSSPLPANASAMNISPGSAGGGGNNGGPVLRTFATLEFQNLPLADSFKILVSRCLAVDPEECPSLSQLLRVCKAEVAKIGDVDALTSQFTSMLMDADTEEYPDP